jgi:hypothetical protein
MMQVSQHASRVREFVCFLALIAGWQTALHGSDADTATIREMTNRSATVITGVCTSSKSRWDETARMIVTDSVFRVDRYLKGAGASSLQITTPGGVLLERNLAMTVSGGVEFHQGEEVLLFLSSLGTNRLSYPQVQGKRLIQRDAVTGTRFIRGQLLDTVIREINDILKTPVRK